MASLQTKLKIAAHIKADIIVILGLSVSQLLNFSKQDKKCFGCQVDLTKSKATIFQNQEFQNFHSEGKCAKNHPLYFIL